MCLCSTAKPCNLLRKTFCFTSQGFVSILEGTKNGFGPTNNQNFGVLTCPAPQYPETFFGLFFRVPIFGCQTTAGYQKHIKNKTKTHFQGNFGLSCTSRGFVGASMLGEGHQQNQKNVSGHLGAWQLKTWIFFGTLHGFKAPTQCFGKECSENNVLAALSLQNQMLI